MYWRDERHKLFSQTTNKIMIQTCITYRFLHIQLWNFRTQILIFKKYSSIERLPWVVPASSFSRYCSCIVFFLVNSLSSVFHTCFNDFTSQTCSMYSLLISVCKANKAFLLLIFHFRRNSTFWGLSVGIFVSSPETRLHKSCPCR